MANKDIVEKLAVMNLDGMLGDVPSGLRTWYMDLEKVGDYLKDNAIHYIYDERASAVVGSEYLTAHGDEGISNHMMDRCFDMDAYVADLLDMASAQGELTEPVTIDGWKELADMLNPMRCEDEVLDGPSR